MFLLAERLRNLGRYTFADAVSIRLQAGPVRTLSACGTLVVVAFYLIAQMVGAGKLIEVLFGLDYSVAVVVVGALMIVYVSLGGMIATTWVQLIKAVLLLGGASVMALHRPPMPAPTMTTRCSGMAELRASQLIGRIDSSRCVVHRRLSALQRGALKLKTLRFPDPRHLQHLQAYKQ